MTDKPPESDRTRLDQLFAACQLAVSFFRHGHTGSALAELEHAIAIEDAVRDTETRFVGHAWPKGLELEGDD